MTAKNQMLKFQEKENNSNWKGDKAVAQTGRSRAERYFPTPCPCEICGEAKTERHHGDGNPLNNEKGNIFWLCRKHHMEADGRMDKWRSEDRPRNTKRDPITNRFIS